MRIRKIREGTRERGDGRKTKGKERKKMAEEG